MLQSYFIGVDISKQKIDVAVLNASNTVLLEQELHNSVSSISKFFLTLKRKFKIDFSSVLTCCENTGVYGKPLERVCSKMDIALWVESAFKIKKATHDIRGKSDQKDARRIADYAMRYEDKRKDHEHLSEELSELKTLQNGREALLKSRTMYSNQLKESKQFDPSTYKNLKAIYGPVLRSIEKQLKSIEEKVSAIVKQSSELKKSHELLTSIPGIGNQNAIQFIIWTQSFRRFDNAKQLAFYAGVVPFPNQSGTVKKRDRVSNHANKELKKIIHMAAISTISAKGEMRGYFERKVAEGKSKMSVVNAIRNKLIHRMIAVIKRGTPYIHSKSSDFACF